MENKTSKGMHIGLWIAQALVALLLLWGAFAKLGTPIDELTQMMPWASENPTLVKITGIVDLLGGLGLLLPALLRIKPELTVYAAYGTIALMVAAAVFHISRGEYGQVGMNVFIIALAAFIAWERSKKAPILAKA